MVCYSWVVCGETNHKLGFTCCAKPNYGLVPGTTAAAEVKESEVAGFSYCAPGHLLIHAKAKFGLVLSVTGARVLLKPSNPY